MKVLSVSVAAYNMARLIRECLDSFAASGVLEEVEILVTDDGSRDETPEIVEEYVKKYPDSVRLIRQENHGPGSTVRSGAEHAAGKYFRMVDSDDRVDPAAFAALVRRLKETEADLVLCGYTLFDDKTGETRLCPSPLPEGARWGEKMPFPEAAAGLETAMHAAVYKTELFRRIAPEILDGFYTDMLYLLLPVPLVKTVEFFEGSVYQYRVALEGQSMNWRSMQKNEPQHRAVLEKVIALYEENREKTDPRTAAFLLRYAVFLSGTQMGIFLSFPPTREAKARFYAFADELREKHPQVFAGFSRFKTARVLRLRGLYGAVSRLHRKKIGAGK